jgi:hypothetical protein
VPAAASNNSGINSNNNNNNGVHLHGQDAAGNEEAGTPARRSFSLPGATV